MKTEMDEQVRELREKIADKGQQIDMMEQELSSIKDHVEGMVG